MSARLIKYIWLGCLLWFTAGCVTRAECDQNNQCASNERCFQSSGTTTSGYCRPICQDVSQCANTQSWLCGSCLSGGLDYCLDEGTEAVCRSCTCDPKCPPGSGCVDGVCVQDAEQECMCKGQPCDEIVLRQEQFCDRDADCPAEQRCALTWPEQVRGLCVQRCEEDDDCVEEGSLCSPCEGELCTSADPGKVCRRCPCSPECPEGYGCLEGVCVQGAQDDQACSP